MDAKKEMTTLLARLLLAFALSASFARSAKAIEFNADKPGELAPQVVRPQPSVVPLAPNLAPSIAPSIPDLPAPVLPVVESPSIVPQTPAQAATPSGQSALDELSPTPEPSATPAQEPGGVFDGAPKPQRSAPADPPFYGRQKAPSDKPKVRHHDPTPEQTAAARREYVRMGATDEEIFNAPTWLEKSLYPELKKAIFTIAFIDEALTDIANAEGADVPMDLGSDVVVELLSRRAQALARVRLELARIRALPRSPAQGRALRIFESWHSRGLATPVLEGSEARKSPVFGSLATAYQEMALIASGREDAPGHRVRALASRFEKGFKLMDALMKARALDEQLAEPRVTISPREAKTIYDRSVREAKDAKDESNVRHLAARQAAIRAGTVFAAPMLGKQLRPTCTIHMLQSLLGSLGIYRSIEDLIKEARELLGDPFIGQTTAFKHDQQLRLFKHYGRLKEVRAALFETALRARRSAKVGIEIGDPFFKHSLIVEGFYQLDGRNFVSLRDSTSYFPTRLTIEDFAKLLTADNAVIMLEGYAAPVP